jgi:hypothetical protein
MRTLEEEQAIIEQAAQSAYRQTALEQGLNPGEVHRLPQCRRVSDYLPTELLDAGFDAGFESHGGRVDEHRFIKIGDKIVDATWQQFLPEGIVADDLPSVWVGSREGLQDLAQLHGVRPEDIRLWDEDAPGRVLSVQERIAAAYDAEMAANSDR